MEGSERYRPVAGAGRTRGDRVMATAHYRSQYSDCPICACDWFDAGFIDKRLKTEYWPEGAWKPDFHAMKQELEDRFGIVISEADIKEHWELHVAHRQDGYQKWTREETKHSLAGDPYEKGWPKR